MNKEELIEEVTKKGYDCFIDKQENIVITKDGYTTTSPLKNSLILMEEKDMDIGKEIIKLPGVPLIEVVGLLIDNHIVQKDINDGVYDHKKFLTEEESIEKLKSIILNQNKDE